MTPRWAGASDFESLVNHFTTFRTGGRDWQDVSWPSGVSVDLLRQVLKATAPLPTWHRVQDLLENMGASLRTIQEIQDAYHQAKLHRPWTEESRPQHRDDTSTTYVINSSGGPVYLHPERRPAPPQRTAEPVIQDAPGYSLKPDPFTAPSMDKLEDLVRAYWIWAGGGDNLSSRTIAQQSGGAFSHATVAKILYNRPDKPKLKLRYLIGLIRGCGGNNEEQQRWASAWRILNQAGKASVKAELKIVSIGTG